MVFFDLRFEQYITIAGHEGPNKSMYGKYLIVSLEGDSLD